MLILHTSDWHVGRSMRGRSRLQEHRSVLAEIAAIAEDRRPQLAIIAGDLFDTQAPSAESEEIVYSTLMRLAAAAEHVVLIAGNHDHPGRLRAIRPLLESGNIRCGDYAQPPEEGGAFTLQTSAGPAHVALLPFVSQKAVVVAEQLMRADGWENTRTYEERITRLLEVLTVGFSPGTVNLVVAHAAVVGGGLAGSEREAHIFDYYVHAAAFPASATYVALGHFHNSQQVPGPGRAWYSGSPLQLDFGEEGAEKHVLLVEVASSAPAVVERVALQTGKRLRTIEGTEAEVMETASLHPDDHLRIVIDGDRRSGLADELRSLFPNIVEIRVAGSQVPGDEAPEHHDRPPEELFGEFLAERGVADERLAALFRELLEEARAPASA